MHANDVAVSFLVLRVCIRSSRQYDLSLEHIQQLKVIVAKEHFTALTQEERDLLWESRHQLCSGSVTSHLTVPMLVRATPGNSPSYRAELYALLNDFKIGDTLDAFALLTPRWVQHSHEWLSSYTYVRISYMCAVLCQLFYFR